MALAIILGFIAGIFLFRNEEKEEFANENTNIVKVTNTVINENVVKEIPTTAEEEKISINTEIIEQVYYNECNHMIETTIKDTTSYVNLTKERLQLKYPKWQIKEFNKDKVVLYMEEDDFCNEHFLVKDVDGYVTIYTLNNSGNILEILKTTDIATDYLTSTDKASLEKGITVYTKQNLNKLIEDFE